MTSTKEVARNDDAKLLAYAVAIVCAYLGHNTMARTDVPGALRTIYEALAKLANGAVGGADLIPAVPIKKSLGDDFIICLEDGKRLTMLKRYLKSQYNMTPDDYRKKWGLPHDYPMVAPAYARLRSKYAKQIGLGRIPVKNRRGARQR